MKRIVPLVLLAFAASAADLFVFSSDGAKVETKPRDLPSAAIRLTDGAAVFGLHALTDAQRGECGWYRVLATPTRTNEVMTVTNYVLRAGTATPIGEWKPKRRTGWDLDRDKVKRILTDAGYGAMFENWNQLPCDLITWWFSEMNYVPGGEIARKICEQFGWTEAQLEEFAQKARKTPRND